VSASAAAALDAGTPDYDSYPVMALIISETGFANGLRG
jgi:hypothetical protein